jgi:solute carrier family 39 (zinc transporter), member 7
VQDLNNYKQATSPPTSTLTSRIFAVLFPGSPAVNALLATLYISGPPNFLLAFCPPNIDPSSLSVMVAFAVGGLLGDTLFHLLPEIFLGEDSPEHVRFVLVEPNKNLLLGVAIIVGFVTFVAMDKSLRIATGGDGGHDHCHGHAHVDAAEAAGTSTALADSPAKSTRSRKQGTSKKDVAPVKEEKEINASVKLAGYLNLM